MLSHVLQNLAVQMNRFYDLSVWKKARRIQLADEPLCRLCTAAGRTVRATDVDHIIPIALGGAELDPDNFRSLCRSCHSAVTARQLNKTDKPMKGCNDEGQPIDPAHPWHQR
jgi:5-methylcytosine-specific restriction protein A